tara:strand:+ start:96 stop:374 length:279 start_codon:yes stop_codon:yes gene_type:complete
MAFKMRGNPFKQKSIKNPKLAEMLEKGFTPTKIAEFDPSISKGTYIMKGRQNPSCPEGKVWDPKTKTCIVMPKETKQQSSGSSKVSTQQTNK